MSYATPGCKDWSFGSREGCLWTQWLVAAIESIGDEIIVDQANYCAKLAEGRSAASLLRTWSDKEQVPGKVGR